ncbi:MAG: HD-GYP domain-containing protein [Bacillota bacterium]|nr:HD-GYP domain-containing protein [Bacillota bacterium]
MEKYHLFLKRLYMNYTVGSLVAVFGVGAIPMFMSLRISSKDFQLLLFILMVSTLVMFCAESIFFIHHLKPIKRAYELEFFKQEFNERAILQLYKFPKLTVVRILGPHYLGFSLTASILSYYLIQNNILKIPLIYILFAFIASIIVASLHALIEFYLTSSTIQEEIKYIQNSNESLIKSKVKPQDKLIPIQIKFRITILLTGIFPIILFLLAALVKLTAYHGMDVMSFLKWAAAILIITIFFSIVISTLMAKDIEKPIHRLEQLMKEVEGQNYSIEKNNVYLDEFSNLFQGFNHMILEINEREQKNKLLINSFLTVLSTALDARDPYTSGHSVRVADFSHKIGVEMGLPMSEVDLLFKTALLHDIGKIGVPDRVLLKDGKLTDEEFAYIKAHPEIGEKILKQVNPESEIKNLLPGVRSHHERIDGKGYPDRLNGDEIPLFGRIIAVADSYDAMTSDRPYRKGMPHSKAVAILLDGSGTQWDSEIVIAFIQCLEQTSTF